MTSTQSDCFACQIMEAKTQQHHGGSSYSSKKASESNLEKFDLIDSTNDSHQGEESYCQNTPNESDSKAEDANDMDEEESEENIETPREDKSSIQLSPQHKQTDMKPRRQRGARPKKGIDLKTFFPQLRRSIAQQTTCLTPIPASITFKSLPQVIRDFPGPVRMFLMQQIDKKPPQLTTTVLQRKTAHKQQMFKNRALQIMDQYFKPIKTIPK